MRSLEMTARVRIINEFLIEMRIQYAVNGMMQESVSDRRFMDTPWFRITY